jgi:hypothetical protein
MQQKNILHDGFVRFEDPVEDTMSVITVVYTDVDCTVDIRWLSQ